MVGSDLIGHPSPKKPNHYVPSFQRLIVNSELLGSKVTVHYGLLERCERSVLVLPGMPDNGGHIEYRDYKCRAFPVRTLDSCDKENKFFCIAWTSAGYFTELSIGFASVACLAIIFGVTTHSRRRRIWRAAAVFVAFHSKYTITLLKCFDFFRWGPVCEPNR